MKIGSLGFALLFFLYGQGQTYKSVNEVTGLPIGSPAYLFSGSDQSGHNYVLAEALKKGPVVLIFYRGYWCPICVGHLRKLQQGLDSILQKGATVVAVSPENPERLKKTEEKTGVRFELVYDEGYKITDAYNGAYLPPQSERQAYDGKLHADLKHAHSDESERLPVPATYIIGRDGKVLWRHFDPDYHIRASVADIVSHLP